MRDTIITIDGPAAAGKSTVARGVAARLGFSYLDTGAIYRVFTLAVMKAGVNLAGSFELKQILAILDGADIKMRWAEDAPMRVLLGGQDVSDEIRTLEVTECIRYLADLREVRERSTDLQRLIASNGRIVCEGRDQGTVVFPNAFLKIYLWASPEIRARRRLNELLAKGEHVDEASLVRSIRNRDRLDMSRELGALKKSADAVEIDSSTLSPDQVVEQVVTLAQSRPEIK